MLKATFARGKAEPLNVLCLGAHSDDIEIGCGGGVLQLIGSRPVNLTWIVFGAAGERGGEAERSFAAFSEGALMASLRIAEFPNSYFPHHWADVKALMEEIKSETAPDVIFTHHHKDLHQDHRVVSELTWNSFRDHTIFEYEIPKYDGDLGAPNAFIHLTEETLERKVELILAGFPSQRSRSWFSADTFRGLARLRGIESNSVSGFAEGYYTRKIVFA